MTSAIDDILYAPIEPDPEPEKIIGVAVDQDGWIHVTWVPVGTVSTGTVYTGTIVTNPGTPVSTGTIVTP